MINFIIKDNLLLLKYQSDQYDNDWVIEKLQQFGKVTFKNTFTFTKSDCLSIQNEDIEEDEPFKPLQFILGRLEDGYFKIDGEKLSTKFSLFIYKKTNLSVRFFVATRNISIFSKIDELIKEDIYIGGDKLNALSEKEYDYLLKQFPNSYELKKYAQARITSILINHFDSVIDGVTNYNKYMNKKISKKSVNLFEQFKETELRKYQAILKQLEGMLKNEIAYAELQWQDEILQVILLLYPKYIHAFKEVTITDTYNNKKRRLDFLIVDSGGSVDLIEIIKPSDAHIFRENKKYRDNFIPLKELSGTVMQIEKYIFYLNKWGIKGEKKLTERYKNQLPDNFKIKIINPSGIIIMGRDNNLSPAQKEDFEIIRRKYTNIIDIITYDDLVRRLRFIIEQLNI
ncbi:MAG: DUF4263 domain-containing protein [Deltaproteobacteria bacterium]|nr:DUF4263 domain-containing protein [Deltaproteobacteria bacterium]